MSSVDLILIGLLVLFGCFGWYQGLIRSVLSVGGTIVGGLVAAAILPTVLAELGVLGGQAALVSVLVILMGVGLGNALALTLGRPLWRFVARGPARVVDAWMGAMVSVVAGLAVLWLIGATLSAIPGQNISVAIRQSQLLARVDQVVPAQAADVAYSVRRLLDRVRVPEVFFGLAGFPSSEVPEPPADVPPGAVTATTSVVRVSGPACAAGSTGSGFVFAPDYVVTNAHVVSGMTRTWVWSAVSGRDFADVVYFDSELDIAVLFVPGIGLPALEPAKPLTRGDVAVVAGYPGGGSLDVRTARIVAQTQESPVFSDNIYGEPTDPRDIYVVRARVIPGNSGGPLLTPGGRYAGVVFASSRQFEKTGFALSNATINKTLRAAVGRTTPVATGTCAS